MKNNQRIPHFIYGSIVHAVVPGSRPGLRLGAPNDEFFYDVTLRVDFIERKFDPQGREVAPEIRGEILNRNELTEKLLRCAEDSNEMSISSAFVSRVISHPEHQPKPFNNFDLPLKELLGRSFKIEGSVLKGSLDYMALYALGKLPFLIDRPLNYERLSDLFFKQKPGLAKCSDWGYVEVNKKPFLRWIAQNWSKLLLTKEELRQLAIEEHQRIEEGFARDFELLDEALNRPSR